MQRQKILFANVQRSGLFAYLVTLTILFLFFEISFLIQQSNLYFGDCRLVSKHLAIPVSVIPGIIFFIRTVCVHFFCCAYLSNPKINGVALDCSWQKLNLLDSVYGRLD